MSGEEGRGESTVPGEKGVRMPFGAVLPKPTLILVKIEMAGPGQRNRFQIGCPSAGSYTGNGFHNISWSSAQSS